jgi:ABC-type branched-subunit amino acid transport system substrate-binding protein
LNAQQLTEQEFAMHCTIRRLMLACLLALTPGLSAAAKCPVKIGAVLPLTGPLAPVVAAMLTSAQIAIDQINAAGGVLGCQAALVVRDSQAQPSVAVDAAHQLIDLEGVRVIVGGVISSDALAMLNSATVPAKVPLISPTASSPTFSEIGGRTGLFFRTNASDALQGVAAASIAIADKSGRVAVLAVNNDWGTNLSKIFKTAYQRLGGVVTRIVLYNQDQSSYRAEVTSALEDKPDTLYLIGYVTEGARIARDWISQGGTQRFLFAHNMNDAAFVKTVGANYLANAVWLTPGTTDTPSLETFRKAYTARTGKPAEGPGRAGIYDAVALAAMAIQAAHSDDDGPAIAGGFRRATDPQGPTVYAGEDGFREALTALADGRPVNYVGAIGPLQFDGNGDIAVPFVKWTLDASGTLQITGRMSVDEVMALRTKLLAAVQ